MCSDVQKIYAVWCGLRREETFSSAASAAAEARYPALFAGAALCQLLVAGFLFVRAGVCRELSGDGKRRLSLFSAKASWNALCRMTLVR